MDSEETIDLVRWTFSVAEDKQSAAKEFLTDLGAEVLTRAEGQIVALWDEPEHDMDVVVEELWEIAGSSIEITHETFRRADLMLYHEDADGEAERTAA